MMFFFYQTCGGVAVGAGLPHFQSAAKAPQAFGANVIFMVGERGMGMWFPAK